MDASFLLKDKPDIVFWSQKSLEEEDIANCIVSVQGTSEKGDGYSGDIKFVCVKGNCKDGTDTEYYLVIKHTKNMKEEENKNIFRECFGREVYIYTKVVPFFQKFQREKGFKEEFFNMPKCYRAFTQENSIALVFENMKALGYELFDRTKPVNLEHLKIVLKKYAKWHALSFSARYQKKEEFFKLTTDWSDIMVQALNTMPDMKKTYDDQFLAVCHIILESNELEVLKMFQDEFRGSYADHLLELLQVNDNPKFVITHNDCWINNFLFKYKDSDRTSPTNVALLDWQTSKVASLVLDLSYFLYVNTAIDEFQHFGDLLTTYYHDLADNIKQFGNDPNILFSFSDFQEQWKQYAKYALLILPINMRVIFSDKDNTIDLEEVDKNQSIGSAIAQLKYDVNLYNERVLAMVKHYYSFKL